MWEVQEIISMDIYIKNKTIHDGIVNKAHTKNN